MIRLARGALALALVAAWATVFLNRTAEAALGGDAGSIESDLNRMGGGQHRILNSDSYVVHELTNGGLRIREYTSKDGVVFALAWRGVNQPDLTQLLGPYFDDFKASNQNNTGKQRALRRQFRGSHGVIRGSRVVVERSGHQRSMRGRAYTPELFPKGVSTDEIQ